MLPLSPNTQRQGVLMAPDGPWWPPLAPAWVPGWSLVAPLRVFSLLSPSCNHGGKGIAAGGGGCGLYGCFEKMCEIGVWVLRVLAQLGVYCAEGWAPYWHPWSPPLTEEFCSAPCFFFFVSRLLTTLSLSLFLSLSRTRCLFIFPFQLYFCSEAPFLPGINMRLGWADHEWTARRMRVHTWQ